MTRFGIWLFPDVEELDWAGPWEVLAMWARYWPDDKVEVFTFSRVAGPIRCAKGARLLADHEVDGWPQADVLLVPGGAGTRPMIGDESVRAFLRHQAGKVDIMTSVCTGALVLADAGLLDGRPATTHWRSLDLLATLGEGIDVRRDERYVDDGDIVTAAGVSAGIDMALHLVARLGSPARAREVRRNIQYDPAPPI